nr:autoinducer-binding protein [Rhizobium sp. Q54]
MKWDFNSLIDRIMVSAEIGNISAALRRFAADCGFDHFAYLSMKPGGAYAISDYPQEWQRRYLREGYERLDPVVWRAQHTALPFQWSMGKDRKSLPREKRAFVDQAAEHGIRSGLSIPLPDGFGRRAILSFASARQPNGEYETPDANEAFVAASLIHAFITVHDSRGEPARSPCLTPQEKLCLRWKAEGKKNHEIAQILQVKASTVRWSLDAAREKLNAVTLPQATAIATALRLI